MVYRVSVRMLNIVDKVRADEMRECCNIEIEFIKDNFEMYTLWKYYCLYQNFVKLFQKKASNNNILHKHSMKKG